jgi:hypothetical protein
MRPPEIAFPVLLQDFFHRRLVAEQGRSESPGRPILYGTGFEFLERFGLTSLDELPPLDLDVASRLAEEGGEAVPVQLFPQDSTALVPSRTVLDRAGDDS